MGSNAWQGASVLHLGWAHREDVWTNPIFQKIVIGGLSWALGHANVDITTNIPTLCHIEKEKHQ